MIKSKYAMVKDFHKAFSYPMADKPTPMDKDMVLNRLGFIAEEMIELLQTVCKDEIEFQDTYTELLDRMDASFVKQTKKPYPEDVLTSQLDACLDIDYFTHGNYTILGIDPEVPFQLVHQANMDKLWNGEARYNEHGKIIKPPHWNAPDEAIHEEIQRQIEAAQ